MCQTKNWLIVFSVCASIALTAAFDNKIVNGSLALPGEYPYMVSLRRASSGRHSCGASLLNRVWALTAAHCVVRAQPHQVNIQFGSNNLEQNSSNVVNISKIFVHEGYNASNQYIHDIALLRLNKPVEVEKDFIGIRLPEHNAPTDNETQAVLIGWGLNAVSLRSVHHDKQHVCAGTILAPQWILTAAHCFTFLKGPKDVLIQYGTNELKPLKPKYKQVQEIITHPGYNPTVVIHDIALVKLESPLTLKGPNRKVELVDDFSSSYENVETTLFGWGLNETFGSLSPKLQKVSLVTLPLEECRLQLQSVIHKTNLCAGGFNRGQCSGDSGGPLMFHKKQIALVSWSLKPCGSKPGVFTNIANYIDWLRNHIDK